MHILSNELSDLIDKEDEATASRLLCKMLFDDGHKAVNIHLEAVDLSTKVLLGSCLVDTFNVCNDLCKLLEFQKD